MTTYHSVTMQGTGSLYEMVDCGCPTRGPWNISHVKLQRYVDEDVDLIKAALEVAGRPNGRTAITVCAMLNALEGGHIERLPKGWPDSQ
jgi:hypothetical protein